MNTPFLPASAASADAMTAAPVVSRDGGAAFSFDPIKFNALLARWGR